MSERFLFYVSDTIPLRLTTILINVTCSITMTVSGSILKFFHCAYNYFWQHFTCIIACARVGVFVGKRKQTQCFQVHTDGADGRCCAKNQTKKNVSRGSRCGPLVCATKTRARKDSASCARARTSKIRAAAIGGGALFRGHATNSWLAASHTTALILYTYCTRKHITAVYNEP